MGMGGHPGRPRPARDAHQPLLVRRNYLLRPRGIAFPDEVMRSRVWPTLGLGYYVSQPFDPMAVSSHNPKPMRNVKPDLNEQKCLRSDLLQVNKINKTKITYLSTRPFMHRK